MVYHEPKRTFSMWWCIYSIAHCVGALYLYSEHMRSGMVNDAMTSQHTTLTVGHTSSQRLKPLIIKRRTKAHSKLCPRHPPPASLFRPDLEINFSPLFLSAECIMPFSTRHYYFQRQLYRPSCRWQLLSRHSARKLPSSQPLFNGPLFKLRSFHAVIFHNSWR